VVVSLVTQRSRRVQRRIDAEFTGAIDIVAGREPHPDVAPAAMTRDAAGGSTAAAADPRAQA
jgi:sodium/proline symporter